MVGKKILIIGLMLILLGTTVFAITIASQIGIPEEDLIGCEQDCFYIPPTQTLSLHAEASIKSYVPGLTVQLNQGKADLDNDGKSVYAKGKGILLSVPQSNGSLFLESGKIIIINISNSKKIYFQNSELNTPTQSVTGTGSIENHEIYLRKAQIKMGDKKIGINNTWMLNSKEYGDHLLSLSGGSYIKDSTGGIMLNEGQFFRLSPSTHESAIGLPEIKVFGSLKGQGENIVYEIIGEPNMFIKNTQYPPSKLILNNKEHFFEGDLLFKGGQTYIPQDSSDWQSSVINTFDGPIPRLTKDYRQGAPHMIDGVYVRPDTTDVGVCFTKGTCTKNSITLGENLHVKGNEFSIALSQPGKITSNPEEVLGGRPSWLFEHDFQMQSKYIPAERPDKALSNTRFIAEMQGGEVIINPLKKTVNMKGNSVITNGINEFYYDEKNVQYALRGCRDGTLSCGTLPYQMNDGGKLDIYREIRNTPIPQGKERLEFAFSDSSLITEGSHSQRDPLKKIKKQITLDRSGVYALGYRGGSAAQNLVGNSLAHREWGHAGVMFFKDGDWWVAEADGISTKIIPFRESLFDADGGKLHGMWKIKNADAQKNLAGLEKIAGARYDLSPFTKDRIHCAEVVCESFNFATGKELEGKVTISHLSGVDKISPLYEPTASAMKSPNWVLGGGTKGDAPEWLEEVYVQELP